MKTHHTHPNTCLKPLTHMEQKIAWVMNCLQFTIDATAEVKKATQDNGHTVGCLLDAIASNGFAPESIVRILCAHAHAIMQCKVGLDGSEVVLITLIAPRQAEALTAWRTLACNLLQSLRSLTEGKPDELSLQPIRDDALVWITTETDLAALIAARDDLVIRAWWD